MRPFLAAWFIYLAVMALLMSASAGRRTLVGGLGLSGAAAAALLLAMLVRWPFPNYEQVGLAAEVVVVAAGVVGLALARREDTRLIALLLTGAALVPILIRFRL